MYGKRGKADARAGLALNASIEQQDATRDALTRKWIRGRYQAGPASMGFRVSLFASVFRAYACCAGWLVCLVAWLLGWLS